MSKEDENNLDLLDLDDAENEQLPVAEFSSPRPRRPWLLLGVALLVIILAVYIIIHVINSDSSSRIDVDLDEPTPELVVVGNNDVVQPAVVVPDTNPQPLVVPVQNDVKPVKTNSVPVGNGQAVVAQPVQPVQETNGVPVRVVEDRQDVTFNPNKTVSEVKAPERKVSNTSTKSTKSKTTSKQTTTKKTVSNANGSWYVQFGSYSSRSAAEIAEKKMRKSHASLLNGKQFVILAAVLQDGKTTYRLRIAFATSNDANGFCRNAKSDGLDCYVAR